MLLKKGVEKIEGLFSKQMERLALRGCPENIILVFEGKKQNLMKLIEKNNFLSNQNLIPFIPVIPRKVLKFEKIIEISGETTSCLIREDEIQNNILPSMEEITKEPYFMVGVENGRETRGLSASIAKERIIAKKMFGINFYEIVAIITHENVLISHLIQCTESKKKDKETFIPNVATINGDPLIYWSPGKHSRDLDWGTASCHLRI